MYSEKTIPSVERCLSLKFLEHIWCVFFHCWFNCCFHCIVVMNGLYNIQEENKIICHTFSAVLSVLFQIKCCCKTWKLCWRCFTCVPFLGGERVLLEDRECQKEVGILWNALDYISYRLLNLTFPPTSKSNLIYK